MVLDRLLVIESGLNGHRAIDEESIAYFHIGHEVIIAAGMYILGTSTEENTILHDIITATHANVELIGRAFTSVMRISHLT